MQELNCIIIEDESLAAEIIRDYIQQSPGLKLVGTFRDALSAADYFRNHKTDLIFLDINLPRITGIEFLKTGQVNCPVIITTAYHEHALDAYNLNVIDYLLKPISFPRFLQAIGKVKKQVEIPAMAPLANTDTIHFFISDKKRIRVREQDIYYIESVKDYIHIYTTTDTVVTKVQISEVAQLLKGGSFIRVHKSFIINLHYMRSYTAQEIQIAGKDIPIGRTYQEIFRRRLEK
jgi:DNA-binding LytR/AlgR family response regulator